jgi:hypothetical protein
MEPGYYWADHAIRGWRIVEVVKGLFGCVMEGGYAVKTGEYSEFAPVAGPGAAAEFNAAQTELHDLRIKAGLSQGDMTLAQIETMMGRAQP